MKEQEKRDIFAAGLELACLEDLFPQQMAVVAKQGREFYVDFRDAMGSQHGKVSVKRMAPDIKKESPTQAQLSKVDYSSVSQLIPF